MALGLSNLPYINGLLAPGSDDSIDLNSILKTIDPDALDTQGNFDPSMFILREKLDDSETMLMDGKWCSLDVASNV